jgi:hypothetical protein
VLRCARDELRRGAPQVDFCTITLFGTTPTGIHQRGSSLYTRDGPAQLGTSSNTMKPPGSTSGDHSSKFLAHILVFVAGIDVQRADAGAVAPLQRRLARRRAQRLDVGREARALEVGAELAVQLIRLVALEHPRMDVFVRRAFPGVDRVQHAAAAVAHGGGHVQRGAPLPRTQLDETVPGCAVRDDVVQALAGELVQPALHAAAELVQRGQRRRSRRGVERPHCRPGHGSFAFTTAHLPFIAE